MKRIAFIISLFLLACVAVAQPLIRTVPDQFKGTLLQYAPASGAKSVVILLHGTGEKGSDITILETNIKFIAALKAGTLAPAGRIILFPQLPSSQTGWYQNTLTPIIAYAKTFNLPIDFAGYSLGGIGVSDNLSSYPGTSTVTVFRSAATACGKTETNDYPPYRTIPSIHYYDPTDVTISSGYTNILAMVTQLQSEGKKDISLVTHAGSPTPHNVWDYAFAMENYWTWLNSLDGSVTPPPAQKHLWINDNIDMGSYTGPAIVKFELK